MRISLIDNNDSFSYNIIDLLRKINNSTFEVIISDTLKITSLKAFSHIIISPGPMTPADFPILKEVIEYCIKSRTPLLGICLGHQAIATYFGGKLEQMRDVVHGEQHLLSIQKRSKLFYSIPATFKIGLYHSWMVSPHTFPNELEIIAISNDKIMAIQHKTLPIYGIQFHPESFLTEYGKEMLTNFIEPL